MIHKNGVYSSWVNIPEKEKRKFKDSSCLLLISVGQPIHEDTKFEASLEKVSCDFRSCNIAVCDTLQRHTLLQRNNFSMDEAFNISAKMGDEWLKRNLNIIEKSITVPYNILRWEEDRDTQEYKDKYKMLLQHYYDNNEFKQAMKATIDEFIDRQKGNSLVSEKDRRKHCFNYLLEECAIIMILWQKKEYSFIVYPSYQLEVVHATWKHFVLPKNPDILKWARIKLKTKKK